jgi:hypothetical protein
MKEVKEGPRTWNNEKRYRMFMMDMMKEISYKLDKLNDTLSEGRFKKSKNEGKDSVLGQVLQTIENSDKINFLDFTDDKEIEKNERGEKKN